jgi:hypothetical protein
LFGLHRPAWQFGKDGRVACGTRQLTGRKPTQSDEINRLKFCNFADANND